MNCKVKNGQDQSMKLEICDLTKTYGKNRALDHVTVTLTSGIYGLLGTNGAGKTTLINSLTGVLRPDFGKMMLDGIAVSGDQYLTMLGYLPQYPRFYPHFSVEEFLDYMCEVKAVPKVVRKDRINNLLSTVNLSNVRGQKIRTLSGGMRQRVGIAQAMLNNPQVLILDEPTAGLDPQERIRFRNLIAEFSGDRTIIIATHIVSDVEFLADQILLLKKGRLVKTGSPSDLCNGIYGKVWEVILSEGKIPTMLAQEKISSMIRCENGIHLRFIADKQSVPNAFLVQPNLEDVFLTFCGEG